MDTGFDPHLHQVRSAFERLLGVTTVRVNANPSPIPKEPGVYVFYRDGKPLRVGTAQDLRERVKQHHGNNHRNAAFAKRLARKETDIQGSYQEGWDEQVKMHPELGRPLRTLGKRFARCLFVALWSRMPTSGICWSSTPPRNCGRPTTTTARPDRRLPSPGRRAETTPRAPGPDGCFRCVAPPARQR